MSRPLAIIVTADDFGIGRDTSRGIIEAHISGPVTATSAMVVTGDHVQRSLSLLESAPNLDVGLHLVLTRCGHKPLAATRASGLVDRAGSLFTNGRLWIRAFAGLLNRQAIEEEIAAQAEMFKRLFGRPPTHVDSHHHCHQLPVIRDALVEVVRGGLLPAIARTTVEHDGMRARGSAKMRRRAAGFIGRAASEKFSQAGLWSNDYFFGMLDPRDFDRDFPWQGYLDAIPAAGVFEWIVHPGYRDETLCGRDDYQAQRTVELERLTSTANRAAWGKLQAVLTRKSVLARTD